MFDAQTLALMILVPALSRTGPDAYSDVVARARRVYDRGTRCDRAHETAHFLHAEQRRLRPGHAVFYLGQGRAVAVREPAVRLSEVAGTVPVSARGSRYTLTFYTNGRHWESTPTYVLDEAYAYLHDNRVRLDDLRRGIPNGGRGIETPADALPEFVAYAAALACVVRERDPTRYRDPRFRLAFSAYVAEARLLYLESLKYRDTYTTAHAHIAEALRRDPACEPLRAVLREVCAGAWLTP